MKQTHWNNQSLSQFMLGTVQFGIPYGVANSTGQPDYQTVLAILEAAIAGGVNCVDTAPAYGTSEEVLGRALQELKVADRVVIVTKIFPLTPEERANPKLAAAAIEKSVAESRRRLRIDCIPVVLFHREADAQCAAEILALKERGWIQNVGVSCDNFPGPASTFAASGKYSALQIPGNLLDHRHRRSGVFQLATERGVAIFIRSVFLQGLLVMPEESIPPHLQAVIPYRRQLQSLADEAGLKLPGLALRYMLSQPGVTSVIIGVENLTQVKENLNLFNQTSLPSDLLEKLDGFTFDLSEDFITPGRWPQLAS